jgi:pyruvate kinase
MSSPSDLDNLHQQLQALRDACQRAELEHAGALQACPPAQAQRARNLLHYLGLRSADARPLQQRLGALGLSRLGRSEARVLPTIDALLASVQALRDAARPPVTIDAQGAERQLQQQADALLGPAPPGRRVRIMVTLPSDAAHDPGIADRLVRAGMSCARINTAHDTPEHWHAMAQHVRSAARIHGADVRVLVDLQGPKLRTGPIAPGPCVTQWHPGRDALGALAEPARVRLLSAPDFARAIDPASRTPLAPGEVGLPIDDGTLARLQAGDELRLIDARGRARTLTIVAAGPDALAHASRSAYALARTPLTLWRGGQPLAEGAIGNVPPTPGVILLRKDDRARLLLAPGAVGRPATIDAHGQLLQPAHIACDVPGGAADLRAGQPIWFDDGKIGGQITELHEQHAEVVITACAPGGSRLRADKGINLPETNLSAPALSDEDVANLPVIAQIADAVALSFVREAHDVADLRDRLRACNARARAIVLKIETRRAFENLPALLLEALCADGAGVMIARGDLAVECGFARLAEVQEEVLWLCEAAGVPVVWATQVLESMAKKGQPSRAEVTDAAMSVRAECVMLNKGPFVIEAVEFLDTVLRRMQEHASKGRPLLRALSVARGRATS